MKNLILIFVILTFVSCGGSRYLIVTKIDQFDGYTSNIMYANWIEANGKGEIGFNVQKLTSKDSTVHYNIIIQMYNMRNWFFIEQGESLVLLIDGVRIGFTGEGSTERRNMDALPDLAVLEETAFYSVTLDQLRSIANAKDVKIKVQGIYYSTEGSLTASNLMNLRQFLKEYANK
ncbi:MAG: hypothetical protein ABSC53_05925 [Bacteroidota bacterium]